jgi:hypothetical protein
MAAIVGALIVAAAMGVTSSQESRQRESIARQEREREQGIANKLEREKAQADERAREEERRRRVGARRSATIRTSPLGITSQVDILQKTLLGT